VNAEINRPLVEPLSAPGGGSEVFYQNIAREAGDLMSSQKIIEGGKTLLLSRPGTLNVMYSALAIRL
jgi:hypothetical protein